MKNNLVIGISGMDGIDVVKEIMPYHLEFKDEKELIPKLQEALNEKHRNIFIDTKGLSVDIYQKLDDFAKDYNFNIIHLHPNHNKDAGRNKYANLESWIEMANEVITEFKEPEEVKTNVPIENLTPEEKAVAQRIQEQTLWMSKYMTPRSSRPKSVYIKVYEDTFVDIDFIETIVRAKYPNYILTYEISSDTINGLCIFNKSEVSKPYISYQFTKRD